MTQDASDLTLPEELLLLTLDPERGKPLCDRTHLRYGTAGAVLAELELQGRIREERGRVQVVNPLDPAHPLLASLLTTLDPPSGKKKRFRPGTSAKAWIRLYGRNAEERHLDHLIERGLLRRETRRFLGVLPYQRHFPGDPDLDGRDPVALRPGGGPGLPGPAQPRPGRPRLGDGPGRHPHHRRPRGPLRDEDRTPRPVVRLGGPPQRPPEPVQRRRQRWRRLGRQRRRRRRKQLRRGGD
ncbi:Golgi phosphoprotein 3 (GPP34) [Streptomyces sp. Ncost-T6T-2b]|nr:Golgi phosphoprotein 3 (GPP34) [Streptomyces sp. Ncost-T6T-2b]